MRAEAGGEALRLMQRHIDAIAADTRYACVMRGRRGMFSTLISMFTVIFFFFDIFPDIINIIADFSLIFRRHYARVEYCGAR